MRTKLYLLIFIAVVGGLLYRESIQDNENGYSDNTVNLFDLSFTDYSGQPVDLKAYEGKYVLLNIWATWCAPCREEMPQLEELHKKLPADEYAILGVSVNTNGFLVQEFLRDNEITFARYIDVDQVEVDEKIIVKAFPTTLLFDKNGRSFYRVVGMRAWTEEFVKAMFKD